MKSVAFLSSCCLIGFCEMGMPSFAQEKFSCFDEEVIIQRLLKEMPNTNQYYVDIGAGDGIGWSNTARLALDGWRGLALEANSADVAKFMRNYRNLPQVAVHSCMVTPFNVCEILQSFGVPSAFGVLSIDIDSYDFFVLEALLARFRPTIIVTEINEKIPPPLKFTIHYQEGHVWDYTSFYGQSIAKVEELCLIYDYHIVALEYNNLILAAKEKYRGNSLSAQEAYQMGYQLRSDRKAKFPWNDEMEVLLHSPPDENINFLNKHFEKYRGRFSLEN